MKFLMVCLYFMVLGSLFAVERVGNGLVVAYDFEEFEDGVIRDVVGDDEALSLKVKSPGKVTFEDGVMRLRSGASIVSEKPAKALSERVAETGEITIEAWIKPANLKQEGPARIVTVSASSSERNFTLGQEAERYEVRFRTTDTSRNGTPALITNKKKPIEAKLSHVVYVHSRSGMSRLYVNGKMTEEKATGGSTKKWDKTYRLALGDEIGGKRGWEGEMHLVAIYGRGLREREILQNYQAGPKAAVVVKEGGEELTFFEHKIAPLLAEHCLECHDTATREGKLDLSKREATMGRPDVIHPGDANASELFVRVDLDEMPEDRPPLSDEEKALLKRWIDEGAKWPLAELDPALLSHGGKPDTIILQRLTIPEYVATVKRATGVDIEKEAYELLPPDVRADGFSNTAYNLGVDLKHVEAYARLAEVIVSQMDVVDFAKRHVEKKLDLVDGDERAEAIADIGKWLMRGPLDEAERLSFVEIARQVKDAQGTDAEVIGYVVEAMLQSPRFMYRMELQKGDGSSLPVGLFELASRMSYIIQGAGPDRELLKAAGKGELMKQDQITAQVKRMLDDPLAVERSRQFISEWLNLGRLKNLRPSPEKFPEWNPTLAEDMREETVQFFETVVWNEERPLADLMNAQLTYLTPGLAEHYRLPEKMRKAGKVSLKEVPSRGGLLTQGSILTIGGDEASMVSRGLFVLHDVLRGVVKDPPPCVDTTPVPAKAGLTQRGIALDRIANNSCGGCHSKFEPLAFGLEKFDGLGSYHEADEFGNRLREDGSILIPGTAEAVDYETSAELMDFLAGSDRVKESITWKVTQFALGRPLTIVDAQEVQAIHNEAQQNGGTWQATIEAIILSDLVQMTRTEVPADE